MNQTDSVFDVNDRAFICQTAAEGSENMQQNQPETSSNAMRAQIDLENGGVVSTAAGGSIPRKLLTTHRTLLVDLKRCAAALSACKTEDTFLTESINFCSQRAAYETFLDALKALKNDKLFYEWSGDLTDTFQKCSKTYEACKRLFCDGSDIKSAVDPPVCGNDSDVEPCDSASQVTSGYSLTSSKSTVVRRRIEVERKRAELDNMQELAKARARKRRLLAEVEAAAEKQRFEAEAEKQRLQARAEKERVLAEAEEAEILAKLRLESIKLKAEEELISCSEYGSSIASKSRSAKIKSCVSESRDPFQKVNRLSFKPKSVLKSGSVNKRNSERQINTNERDVSETKPSLLFDCSQSRGSVLGVTRKITPLNFESKFVSETRCNYTLFDPLHNTNDVAHAGTVPQPGVRNFNFFNPDSQMRNSVIATNELTGKLTSTDRVEMNILPWLPKLLTMVVILPLYFLKIRYAVLWKRVPLRSADLRFCVLLAWANHGKWLTCFVPQ